MAIAYTPAIAEVIEKLETGNPLPTLVPQNTWSTELTNALESASLDELFDGESLKIVRLVKPSKAVYSCGMTHWMNPIPSHRDS